MFPKFQDYKVLESIAECFRVLQSISECYRVLQSVTEYYKDKYSASTETNFWASMYIDFTVQYQFNLSLDIALA